MAPTQHTHSLLRLEESPTVLFCLVDEAYTFLTPHPWRYQSLKRLSDSEVIAPGTLPASPRGEKRALVLARRRRRTFSHPFPGVVGPHPSSLNRRVRKLRRFLWSLCDGRYSPSSSASRRRCARRLDVLLEILHPRQEVGQSAGFAGAAWR